MRTLARQPLVEMARNLSVVLPPVRARQAARSTTGAMNDPETMVAWAQLVTGAAERYGLDLTVPGTSVAEVGPGHSLGVAVSLLASGVWSAVAIDVERYADPTDVAAFQPVVAACRRAGLASESVLAADLLDQLDYRIVRPDGVWPVPDASFDLVYSFFAGEHLRRPDLVLDEVLRKLKPGGLGLFLIDLRDHRDFGDDWLGFLRHGDRTWEAMASRRGCWCNRMRVPEWRATFEARFDIVEESLDLGLPLPTGFDRADLAPRFRNVPMHELMASGVTYVVRRPGARTATPAPRREAVGRPG